MVFLFILHLFHECSTDKQNRLDQKMKKVIITIKLILQESQCIAQWGKIILAPVRVG